MVLFNKSEKMIGDKIPFIDGDEIYMSAKQKIGIEELLEMISKEIYKNYIDAEMLIPFEKGSIISYLNENATIYSTEYLENGTKIKITIPSMKGVSYEN